MKKALVFSGQSRFVKQGYQSLKNNLVDFDNYDVFIHTWDGLLTMDCLQYKPKSMRFEKQVQVVPKEFGTFSESEFIHFSMFYSMMKSLELKQQYEAKNNFRYDLVIRTRFDISLEDKLDPEKYITEKTCVFSPNVCANPNVISDWFNFGTSQNIDLFSMIYKSIGDYKKAGVMITSGEELITHMLKTNNLAIGKTAHKLYLLRDRNIHKNLSSYWKYAE